MSVKFYWCHTNGCPNYGRARRMEALEGVTGVCPFCSQAMHITAPDELPAIVHEVDEENQIKLTEDDLSEG